MFLNIRNILTVLTCAVISCGNCYSQPITIGSVSASMGRSSVALIDIWGNNPACLVFQDNPVVGCYYESKFLLQELSVKALCALYPTTYGGFSLSYVHTGYELYNNQGFSLKYARLFKDKISFGVHLDYLISVTGNNYGTNSGITFGLGFMAKVSETITLAAYVYNPIGSTIGNERINTSYGTAVGWFISKTLFTTLEIEKNSIVSTIIIRGGIQYSIKERYFFRAGFSTNNEYFSFGAGMVIGKLNLNISSIMHNSLGFSTQAGLSFNF